MHTESGLVQNTEKHTTQVPANHSASLGWQILQIGGRIVWPGCFSRRWIRRIPTTHSPERLTLWFATSTLQSTTLYVRSQVALQPAPTWGRDNYVSIYLAVWRCAFVAEG